MSEQPAPWLEEILRTAGDTSPVTASKIRQSAEDTYRRFSVLLSEAWAQYAGRYAAKMVLAEAMADSRPTVQAALLRYLEAEEHANSLSPAGSGITGRNTEADAARRESWRLHDAYRKTFAATRAHYVAEVNKAWRQADKDFLLSRRAALEAADPEGFKRALARLTEDLSPSAGPSPGSPPTVPSESQARHAQGTSSSSESSRNLLLTTQSSAATQVADAMRRLINPPPRQSGAEESLVRAKKARMDGEPYISLSGHPWQCWLVAMEDGTQRRTATPASGGGSGPRAARQNAEQGPCRSLDQPSWRESVQRWAAEGRRDAHPDAGKTAPRPAARPASRRTTSQAKGPARRRTP